MTKICKPYSLFVAVAALALFASSSTTSFVAAQEDSGIELVNLDADIVGAVAAPSDDLVGNEAPASSYIGDETAAPTEEVAGEAAGSVNTTDAAPSSGVTEEARSADELAQNANKAAVPEEKIRSDDAVAAAADKSVTEGGDAVPKEDVASDADAATVDAADDTTGSETTAVTDATANDIVGSDATILGGATILGKSQELELNDAAVSVLVDALSTPTNYDPTITAPICVLQINSAQFQTVSGTNYRYQVLGCAINFADELGACRNRQCTQAPYEVTIYQQTWTNTLQVSAIALTE